MVIVVAPTRAAPIRPFSLGFFLPAFVRHPPHEIGQGPDPGASEDGQAPAEKAEKAEKAGSTNKIRPDVQAVLNLLADKTATYRQHLPAGYRLNFSYTDLTRADLTHANLTGADLFYANLTDARLTANNLTQEQLDSACIIEGGKPPSLPEGLKPPQKVCVL